MQLNYRIDFTNAAEVKKVNKARGLGVWRANRRHGLAMKRQSTTDRKFTEENSDEIIQMHEDYAPANNGQRVPLGELVDQYNAHFGEDRTHQSMTSHISRNLPLRDMRQGYPA